MIFELFVKVTEHMRVCPEKKPFEKIGPNELFGLLTSYWLLRIYVKQYAVILACHKMS